MFLYSAVVVKGLKRRSRRPHIRSENDIIIWHEKKGGNYSSPRTQGKRVEISPFYIRPPHHRTIHFFSFLKGKWSIEKTFRGGKAAHKYPTKFNGLTDLAKFRWY